MNFSLCVTMSGFAQTVTYYYYYRVDEALSLQDPCENNFGNLTAACIIQLFGNI